MDPQLVTMIGTLGGAALGVAGTMWAQSSAAKREASREASQRAAERRRAALSAVNEFQRAASTAQEVAGNFFDDLERKTAATSELWATRRLVAWLAPGEVADAAMEVAQVLNVRLWSDTGSPVWAEVNPRWQRFEEACSAFVAEEAM